MRSIVHSVISASIDTAIEEGNVGNIHGIALVSNIVGVLNFFFLQVKNHDAEATGNVSQIAIESDLVDAFVAHDGFFLDVTHILDVALGINEVDIGVRVSDKKLALAFVVTHSADADVRQTVDFV